MQKLSIPMKLGYGVGGLPHSIKDVAFVNFVLFYYTQVVGLSGTQTGLVLMIAMIWDAFSDPIIGSFSDNFRSKWGRRHPFMVVGMVPLALTFIALFSPPMDWSTTGKFWWLLVTCILLRTFLTIYFIPFTSLAPELSEDYQERSTIIGYRYVLGWLNYMILYYIVLKYILVGANGPDGEFIDGRLIYSNYTPYAIISCILVIVYSTTCILATKRYIPQLRAAAGDAKRFSPVQILRDFKWALGNRNFRIMCLTMLTGAISVGVTTSLNLIIGTYFFEFTTGQLANVAIFQAIGAITAFLLLKPLGKRFDKHRIITACYIAFGFTTASVIGARLLGLLPENGHWVVYAFYVANLFVAAIFTYLVQVMLSSYTGDIVDEQEYQVGRRQEGVFYAAELFAGKAITGFGNMFGGFILDFVSFPSGARPGEVPEEALFKLGVIVGPVMAVTFLIPVATSLLFRLTREQHVDLIAKLDERKTTETESSPP